MDFTTEIGSHTLEYVDETHTYLVDGMIVPSMTQIVKYVTPDAFASVPPNVLAKAAKKGTAVHAAIENYCINGVETDAPELRGFKFFQNKIPFTVKGNEIPVILAHNGFFAAGRLDLVIEVDGKTGGADIKCVTTVNREYCTAQLNLYRLAYRYSYGVDWEFLKIIQVKDLVRKFIDIPIKEKETLALLNKYFAEPPL